MPAVSEHIWALLTTADHNHSWETLGGPPGTHLPKPPLIVLTAVKQGIDSPERVNQTPGKKSTYRVTYGNLTCVLKCRASYLSKGNTSIWERA